MKLARFILATALLALLAGCATHGGVEAEPVVEDRAAATGTASDDVTAGAEAGGAMPGAGFTVEDLDDPASLLSQRVVYFAFDSNEISEEAAAVIEAHARFLAAHPEMRVIVEGHTDERGSQEYNLALGERRAEAVKRVLVLHGVLLEQVEVVSYGEEKPAVEGSNEEAWALNRRAELVYQR